MVGRETSKYLSVNCVFLSLTFVIFFILLIFCSFFLYKLLDIDAAVIGAGARREEFLSAGLAAFYEPVLAAAAPIEENLLAQPRTPPPIDVN